jgi:hypothetical protein
MTRILVAALLLLTCAPLRAQHATTGTFEGYVASQKDDKPIKGVKVTFKISERGTVYKTKTNADGYFRRDGLPPGEYEISISAKGYETVGLRQRLGTLTPNQIIPLPVRLKPRK